MSRRDPDARCCVCDTRLYRTRPEHDESACIRRANSWPPFQDDPLPVTSQLCDRCGGEGKLYTSRYGGNDPDVWPTGECPVCEGTGYALQETADGEGPDPEVSDHAEETPAAKARHDARFEAEAEFREQERERLAEREAEDAG